jgi:hypothetical protein
VAPGRGARSVSLSIDVRLPHSFDHSQPNSNSVAVSHARRNGDTVPITDSDADTIRHRVADGLRDADTHSYTNSDRDCHADCDRHGHADCDRHADTYPDSDCNSDCLRIGRSAVIPGA